MKLTVCTGVGHPGRERGSFMHSGEGAACMFEKALKLIDAVA